MARRRKLRRVLGAIGQSVSDVAGVFLRQKLQEQGEQRRTRLEYVRQAQLDLANLGQTLGQKVASGDLEPEKATAQFSAAIRQFGLPVAAPYDFTAFVPSEARRLGGFGTLIRQAQRPEDVPGPEALRSYARERGIKPLAPPAPPEPRPPGLEGFIEPDRPERLADILVPYREEAMARRESLLAGLPPQTFSGVIDPSTLAPGTVSIPGRQLRGERVTLSTGLSPEQDATSTVRRLTALLAGREPELAGAQEARKTLAGPLSPGVVAAEVGKASRTAAAGRAGVLGVEKREGVGAFQPVTIDRVDPLTGEKVTERISPTQTGEVARSPAELKEFQSKAFGYATTMAIEHEALLRLEAQAARRGLVINAATLNAWEAITDATTRQLAGATRRYINGLLRRQSGMAVTETEYERYQLGYGYRAGDDAASLTAKQSARRDEIRNAATEAGPQIARMFVTIEELDAYATVRGLTRDAVLAKARRERVRIIY